MKIHHAKQDPANFFSSPDEVLYATDLSDEEKIAILYQWKDEILQQIEAEAEGMVGDETSELLQEISDALISLDYIHHHE